jgi:hypothetical protein
LVLHVLDKSIQQQAWLPIVWIMNGCFGSKAASHIKLNTSI